MGTIAGTLRAPDGRRASHGSISITGGAGVRVVLRTNSEGEFSVTLPYGRYRLAGERVPVFVAPLQTTRLDLVVDASGTIRLAWHPVERERPFPDGYSLGAILLNRAPSIVTEPLDFTDIANNRLAVVSDRGVSWTATSYRLNGMDASDSYQPGIPAVAPDVEALDEVTGRSQTAVDLFLTDPGRSWHGGISTAHTGGALTWSNLPAPADRGAVQQDARYHWFTRDRVDAGGPVTKRADVYASAAGQWASQTEPLAAPGNEQHSRMLFGNARGRVRAGDRDQFEGLFSGSRINLSDGGIPAALEALSSDRMAPSFVRPGGFSGQGEVDHLDFFQAGWTHFAPAGSHAGTIQIHYGYSVAHLSTSTVTYGQSRIELLGGTVTGAPPLANLAVRPRHGIEAAWAPAELRAGKSRHRIEAGGGWERSAPRNRFNAPSGMNLITANGAPAFVTGFNTPAESSATVGTLSGYLADQVTVARWLSFDVGLSADFSRGSLPAQSSPLGAFTPAREFAAQSDLIVWNSVSPRAGVAVEVPHAHGLVLRGAYFRRQAPLAGRYLDFGNPNSLGGNVYQWTGTDASDPFRPDEQGLLLRRFGGPYSSISPWLRRPYADEFDVGAEFPVARRRVAGIHLFRRDEKNRIAAIDTGVPVSAFTPVSIVDPGPDGIAGTYDDQRLTVYAQNPATFGEDRYLLTNPAGLRMLNAGVAAEAGAEWRGVTAHASFVAEKSYGPTNPGNAVYENDPGVIGALFMDPNTAIHASGRSFVDRAYVGKIRVSYRFPPAWGGVEVASVADYTDGLVFARRLLVAGLPQGPLLVATTVRGSPEGGNRAEYVLNWNLRVGRRFGRVGVWGDLLNVSNAGNRLQESDLSGPSFNRRLPVAIQPPRSARLEVRYEF
jgi:hypothetical protein